MEHKIEFEGYISGDYESECFDIDKETFKRLNAREPRDKEKSYFFENTYRYYPFEGLEEGKYKVSINIEKIKE